MTTNTNSNRMPACSCAALSATAVVAVLALVPAAFAQAVEQLPPVVVQGATLAPTRAEPKRVVVDDEPDTSPAPKRKPKNESGALKPNATTGGAVGPPANDATVADDSGNTIAGAGGTGSAGNGNETGDGLTIDRLGSSVSVVTGAELREKQVRHVGEALRSLPGVSVNRSGGATGLTQVRIRGAEGNHTLVLIDGIEANDTFNGEFDFADLSADDVESIEVIRGGYSSLYGSGAVGGVVNIITRGGKGPLTFQGRVEGGSFGTFDTHAKVSGGNDQVWGSVSIGRFKTQGFDISPAGIEDDAAGRTTFAIRGGARILDGMTLDYTLRRARKTGDRDTQAPFPDTSGVQVDDPATFVDTTWLGGIGLTWDTFDKAFTQVIRAKWNESKRTDTAPGFTTDNLGERLTYSYAATYRFETPLIVQARHSVTGLVESESESFTPSSTFADSIERTRDRLGFAAEYRGEFADRLDLTGTVRRDDNQVFEDFTTWRASASLRMPEIGLRPHASVGTSVKFPTLFEQFGFIPIFFNPNPNLTFEESFGWDAGVEFTLLRGRAVLDVTYFKADLENEIRGIGFPTTPINLDGKSERQGIEIAGRVALARGLRVGASYTYLDATDPNGQEEIRRPPHSGRVDVNYVFDQGRANLNAAAVYNGDMTDTNFGPFPSQTVTLGDYWLVSVAASYKVHPGVEFYGRVENALDSRYQEVFGFETAGLAAYAGLRLTYEDLATLPRAGQK